MRRGIGVAHVQTAAVIQQKMADVGAQLDAQRTSQLQDHIELLEKRLQELATKHEALVRRDPLVRAKLKEMAAGLGVDLLGSRHNVFSKALGFGDYYYELCVRIVEICMTEKPFCGGMVPLATVLRALQKAKPQDGLAENDVVYALEKLRVLGSGYDVVSIGAPPVRYIRATPEELSTDAVAVLQVASSSCPLATSAAVAPCVTSMQLATSLRWAPVRIEAALHTLLESGLAWIDTGGPEGAASSYWFPFLSVPTFSAAH